ncbi:hypothetical protein [Chroococcidiopsis sp.]|uniref:hypothetical protein n=1 Tax=Chroococcidiopsis sp. TaxID=3088168 RepID=UPI003F35CCCC
MPASTGYSVSTLANLKDIDPSIRADRYIRAVQQTSSWYMFFASATNPDDGLNYITPTVGTGRWYRMRSMIVSSDILDLFEYVQDTIGNYFQDSVTLDFSYSDTTNTFSINLLPGTISDTHIAANANIAISKINGLVTTLQNKAESAHTHNAAVIIGLTEAVQDILATSLQSSNITINYDDGQGIIQLTAPSASGGGTADWDTIDETVWDSLF